MICHKLLLNVAVLVKLDCNCQAQENITHYFKNALKYKVTFFSFVTGQSRTASTHCDLALEKTASSGKEWLTR
jgi:hypothetical protein